MGVLQAGLVGQIRKKAGNFVFSNWKGINTARAYAIPANPNTVPQQNQRSKFKAVVQLASSLLATLIVTFWNPLAVGMSGFNSFVKSIFPDVSSTGLIQVACKVTKGTLEPIRNLVATYTTGTGAFSLTWVGDIIGNGLATDHVNVLILNSTDNSVVAYIPTVADRSEETFDSVTTSGLTATNLIFFVWCDRGTGSEFMVSDSLGDVASA